MNDSNMTGTGFPNAVPQASSNRETGKKTTRSAIGAKAQTILDFLRQCTPYEADSIRVMVGHATGKGDTDTIEATDLLAVNRFLNHGLTKENATGNEAVMRHRQERAQKLMSKLYKPFLLNNFRVIFMDIPSAEMTKYAANSMLATRISFMNDIANLCEIVGADVNMVRSGIGSDTRIGRKFLYPGIGYGGSCFPKDVKALIKTAEQNGYKMRVLSAVEEVNEQQKSVLFEKLVKHFNGDLKGKTVALWGLAFKPETDDMREAPALILIDKLLKAGCQVRAYDSAAMQECKRRIGDTVYYACDMYDAVLDADALMLVTEWKEFRLPSWAVIKKTMAQQVVLDGRNIYDKKEMEELGFVYYCIGK